MKIVLFNARERLTSEQQKLLATLGSVVYTKNLDELPLSKLLEMAKGAEIIGVHPFPLGGLEKGKENLTKIMKKIKF